MKKGFLYIFLLLLVGVCCPLEVSGQVDSLLNEDDIITEIEDVISSVEIDEQVDYTYLTDMLEYFKRNPVNLNKAPAEALRLLPGWTDIHVNSFLRYREAFGELGSIFELQAVPGFRLEMVRSSLPYVGIGNNASQQLHFSQAPRVAEVAEGIQFELIHRYVGILEEQKGYTDPDSSFSFFTNSVGDTTRIDTNLTSRYRGNPQRHYTRLRARYGNKVSIALVGEKDPGELTTWDPANRQYGYDFLAGHIALQNYGKLKSLVVGDYTLQFGQGVILSRGLGFGKSAQVIRSLKMPARGIQPYVSVNENQYLRGVASTLDLGKWELTAFGSQNYIDASLLASDTLTNESLEVSSLQLSGLHRTRSELRNRKSLRERMVGGRIAFQSPGLSFGTTHYVQTFDRSISRAPNAYNRFDFQGDQNYLNGLDFDWVYKNVNVFGEAARSKSGGWGGVVGLMGSLGPKVDVAMNFRHFDKDFHSSRGYVFAERPTSLQNETGLYVGVKLLLSTRWTIDTYFDQFYFPYNRFRAYGPSRGYEMLTQITYRPQRYAQFYLRFRTDHKEENASDLPEGQKLSFLVPVRRNNLRFHYQQSFERKVTIRTRVETTWFQEAQASEQFGFLAYQDLIWKPTFSFQVTARYAYFDTPSYDTRIYAYENDILGFFSIPPYYRKGSRYYGILRYKFGRNIEFWARYAQTRLSNVDTFGSGLNRINGNTQSEIKLQVRIKF